MGKKKDEEEQRRHMQLEKFIDIELITLEGERKWLSEYVGHSKFLFIDFWASWCGPSIADIPKIKQVYEKYKDKGLEVLLKVPQTLKNLKILDLCTGSGCIAISLALILKPEVCVGTDISEKALKIAKANGENLAPMVKFIQSDLFENVTGSYDLIISNPPYITTEECGKLMPEVKDYEPMLALDGKEDGLYFYKKIIKEAKNYLNPDGMLAFEIGYDQGEAVKNLMEAQDFSCVEIKKDLAGLDRLVFGFAREGE